MKARERRAVQRERFGQKLQRDGLFERKVFRAVDLAHAAATDEADDAVALVQYRAGDEARAFERIRCRVCARASRGRGRFSLARRVAARTRLRVIWKDARLRVSAVNLRAARGAREAIFGYIKCAGRTLHFVRAVSNKKFAA